MKKFIRYLIVLSLLVATASICVATPAKIRRFDNKTVVQTSPAENGQIFLNIDITPNYECDLIKVNRIFLDNLTSQDLIEQQLAVKKGIVTNLKFSLQIPNKEISGIEYTIEGCKSKITYKCYFAALGDTVLTYLQKPKKTFEEIEDNYRNPNSGLREGPGSIKRRQEEKERKTTVIRHTRDSEGNQILVTDANRDSIEASYRKRMADWSGKPLLPEPRKFQVNFEDGTDSLMTREEIGKMHQQMRSDYKLKPNEDGTYSFIKRIDPQLKRMRELEQEPLTYSDQESITVDGIIYERNKGEYKFHEKCKVSTMNKRTHYDPRIDSIGQSLKGMESEYLIDLREPNDLEFVKRYLDSLVSTGQRGFYISKVPLEIRKIFREHGIKGYMIRNSDRENRIKKMIENMINDSTSAK